MVPANLDIDVLRAFVNGVDLASFAKAADKLGRSPSAISLQLRKLEHQTGQSLLLKKGRGLVLTEAGETLLSYARRILDLNDEALAAMRTPAVEGSVRLGLPQDLAEAWLPGLLARFARTHPNVRVEAHVERNAILLTHLANHDLDLALAWDEDVRPTSPDTHLADLPMVWVGPSQGFIRDADADDALPLVAFASPCVFRRAGVAALDAAGISWRVAFSSPSLSGLWAAVSAGLGVTLRTPYGVPSTLTMLDAGAAGLPALPRVGISLRTADAQPSPAVTSLQAILRETLLSSLGS